MEIAYWIVAALLGVVYLFAGGKKVAQSREQLAPMMGWVDTIPMWAVRCIGVVEILGVLGLVLPPVTGVAPALALVSAIGFAVLQVLAAGLHLSRREVRDVWLNGVLLVLAVVAAWLATVW
ncbi:DoxX family protein [Amycolatopsis acidicola]|uniref:DoxX family protein n=1 Tax=Amycolatopsis acidicola TaxID=2596893 RepID=A0A5N0V5K3_9PSEU|nr:DoxX family protein [Amycolatopsis acidicola]KAA9159638.1 DoxX family protein [Amycolatopsis acidicola]